MIFSLLFSFLATASDRPFWTEKISFVEGEKLYVVGVASHSVSVEVGRAKALENAKKELQSSLHLKTLEGVPILTQMTYEEPAGAGTTVYRLLYISLEDFKKKVAHKPKSLACFEAIAGRWNTLTMRSPGVLELNENCGYTYQSATCSETGRLNNVSAASGTLDLHIQTAMGAKYCGPEGHYQCKYIVDADLLTYDCGHGPLKFVRVRNVQPREVTSEAFESK